MLSNFYWNRDAQKGLKMLQMDFIWLQEGMVPPMPAGLLHQDKICDGLHCPQILGLCSRGAGEAMDTTNSPELDSKAELQLLRWVYV